VREVANALHRGCAKHPVTDILFERGVSARKFASTKIDASEDDYATPGATGPEDALSGSAEQLPALSWGEQPSLQEGSNERCVKKGRRRSSGGVGA
jgi:hypothetical protein